jgi:hypothetical protein
MSFSSSSVTAAAEALRAIARDRWLKNEEIVAVLSNISAFGLGESLSSPDKPKSGQVFVFNKRERMGIGANSLPDLGTVERMRLWRRDGHEWKKKKDGKNVMEYHEKWVNRVPRCYCTESYSSSIVRCPVFELKYR